MVQTVGILSPGDMGHAVGAVLRQGGLRVITCLRGRSARTFALAAEAGIEDMPDDETLVQEAEILLSILVPAEARAAAERVARAVRATGADLLFAECNAIAPRTVCGVAELLVAAGARCVDAGIIGGPPVWGSSGTRFYASGQHAAELAALAEHGLSVRIAGDRIGQASGLKMCYAALTKGITALATESLTAAKALGLDAALRAELEQSQHALLSMIARQVTGMPPKAHRWVGEMEEIASTFADVGLTPRILAGAADIYRFVAQTPLGAETPESRQRGQTLDDVTAILAASLENAAGTEKAQVRGD
jgi:3-hydroxyisobutyrate dehydrogenase-like beta-hydroxyacid dehydrogenase